MDISFFISVIIGFGCLIVAFLLEGGQPSGLLVDTAAMIVFGGTIGAIGIAFPAKQLKRIPAVFRIALSKRSFDVKGLINYFKDLSGNVRKNGVLSLETEISNNNKLDNFTKKGLQMVADGVDPEMVRSTLELKLDILSERHKEGAAIFEAAGGFAPTMGIIGTVMGLVNVLSNLSDPNSLGPKIAVAFIATLYGVGSANLLWLPIANKLKVLNKIELLEKQMVIEAILLIQEGANTSVVVGKLESFLTAKEAEKLEASSDK